MHNNIHWWFAINKFAPCFITMTKGSQIRSAISKDDDTIRVYAHTFNYLGEANIPIAVDLAKSLINWEVYEFRVFRAPCPTPDLSGWTFLDTVKTRQGRCINHVYYRLRRDLTQS